ncbi:unnamed protein product, partial [Effrenium voratum]
DHFAVHQLLGSESGGDQAHHLRPPVPLRAAADVGRPCGCLAPRRGASECGHVRDAQQPDGGCGAA